MIFVGGRVDFRIENSSLGTKLGQVGCLGDVFSVLEASSVASSRVLGRSRREMERLGWHFGVPWGDLGRLGPPCRGGSRGTRRAAAPSWAILSHLG